MLARDEEQTQKAGFRLRSSPLRMWHEPPSAGQDGGKVLKDESVLCLNWAVHLLWLPEKLLQESPALLTPDSAQSDGSCAGSRASGLD